MATSREPPFYPDVLPVGPVIWGLVFLAVVMWWASTLVSGLGH